MSSSDSTPSDTATQSSASMLHGHVAYVKGAVEETIGSLTSSEPWKTSGQHDKSAAVKEMRAAKDSGAGAGARVQNPTVGKIEKTLGGVVGCEGMVEEGGKVAK